MPADNPYFPAVPHRAAGVDCTGSIVAEVEGENVNLKCNACGVVVGRINAGILEALDQAVADRFVFHKFEEMDAPRVLTSISEECQRGECEKCPGQFPRPDHGEEPIFCVHECHEVANDQGADSIN